MTCSTSIWRLPRPNSGPGVRLGSTYLCSVSLIIYIFLSFLASTLLLQRDVSSELSNAESKLVLDVYKGKFGGKFDSIPRFKFRDFFREQSVGGYCYRNGIYNLSGTLSVDLVVDTCDEKFCRPGAICDRDIHKGGRHKTLVVFLPDDGVTRSNPRLLYQIQGTLFSTLASGTFEPDAQVVFIRSHLRDYIYDDGNSHVPAPLQAIGAYDVCKSLASNPVVESKYFYRNVPYGVVDNLLKGHKYDITAASKFLDYRYIETPTALMLEWYQLLAFNKTERDNNAENRLFNKISGYVLENTTILRPSSFYRSVVYPNEIVPTSSLIDNAVVMVFGNNQFFANAIHAGRLLAKAPSTGEERGPGYFFPAALSPNSGIVENTDECVKLNTEAITRSGHIRGDTRDDICYPLLMPSMLLADRKGINIEIRNIDELPARDVLPGVKELLCGTGPSSQCAFLTYNRQYIKDSTVYPGEYSSSIKNTNNTFEPKNYYKKPSDTRYNSMRVANLALANFMANFKPNKIIQIVLIPRDDKLPGLIPGEVPNTPNKDVFLPLITAMGCPSVGLTHSNDNIQRNMIDSSIMSYCSKDSPRRKEYGPHHCNSFSTYFDNIENNLPYSESYSDKVYPDSSCRNTVLTLHMTDDPGSVFNYGKMINYYHQIIGHHLASGCDTKFSKASVKVGKCVAYNTRYMYNVDSGIMHVVDTGEEVVLTCNISNDDEYREHGDMTICIESYDKESRSKESQQRMDMCRKRGIAVNVNDNDADSKNNSVVYGVVGVVVGLVFVGAGVFAYRRVVRSRVP